VTPSVAIAFLLSASPVEGVCVAKSPEKGVYINDFTLSDVGISTSDNDSGSVDSRLDLTCGALSRDAVR